MARKKKGAFRTISEVSQWLDTPTHVIRFWESKFDGIEPVKRAGGRRYYRPEDLPLIGGIKTLLHDEGKSIASVLEMIESEGEEAVIAKSPEVKFESSRRRRKSEKKEEAPEVSETLEENDVVAADDVTTAAAEEEIAPDPAEEKLVREEEPSADPLMLTPLSDEAPTDEASDAEEPVEEAPGEATPEPDPEFTAESSARDAIENALSQKSAANNEVLVLSVDAIKSKDNIDEIEELYFDLQMMRNRIKRALRELH